jgi:exodeoxyribonuclease V alpha subunit
MDNIEKERLLKTLTNLNVFSSFKQNKIETHLPFFDKTLLPVIDYLTIRDLIQLAGYQDNDVLFAVLLCMFDTLQQGSLCLDLEKNNLKSRLQAFSDKQVSSDTAEKFLSGLDQNQYDGFISRNRDQFMPLVVSEIENRKLLYFQKYYVFERQLKKRIEKFLSISDVHRENRLDTITLDDLVQNIFSPELVLRVSKGGNPIIIDPYQVKAIKLALYSRFCIISGGPGTGKTSLMVNLLRCIVRTGIEHTSIILCAPTGKAAQRMTEAIHNNINTIQSPADHDLKLLILKASTLHKALHYRPYLNDFHYKEQTPLPTSVVIMDEVSMVDVAMMEKFLRAINPFKTQLILLGDKDQLPSVEAGAVFGTMIPQSHQTKTFENHLVVLKNNYRSGRELQYLAQQVNSGKSWSFEPIPFKAAMSIKNDQWAVVIPKTSEQWQKDLALWANVHLIQDGKNRSIISLAGAMNPEELINSSEGREILEKIFQNVESSKVLTLIKEGIWGSIGINRLLAGYLSDHYKSSLDWIKTGVFSGALIIIMRNDYSKALFNGDTGVVIKDPQGVFRAYFKRFDSYLCFSLDLLPAWEPAYALTVHKCQGSEFENILVVLPADEKHRLLTRQMIYTAVTRAKKKIIIYGKSLAIQNALKQKIQRESGLLW